MAFLCVGGEHEGMTIESPKVTHTFPKLADWEKEESYIKIARKGEPTFFMLCGMKPVDAITRFRELTGATKPA